MHEDLRDGTWQLPPQLARDRLDRVLKGLQPVLSWQQVRQWIARGKVTVDGAVVTDAARPVVGGQRLALSVAAPRAAVAAAPLPELAADAIVHLDAHVVVVQKPAGVETVLWDGDARAGTGDGAPLSELVATAVGGRVHVVQRLDRETTGLLVFARTREAEGRLAHQFRRRTVHRRYLALVHGACAPATIRSTLAVDRGDGLRGSVPQASAGKLAVTHVEPQERLSGATLVACRLETGRTHQIRIHLAERGHMLLGERAYVREHRGPVLPAPRLMLHAHELGFVHPSHDAPLRFLEPMPADMAAVVAALRAG
jgi:23S rRNA pseudouridine1911/1915/1917 synthase